MTVFIHMLSFTLTGITFLVILVPKKGPTITAIEPTTATSLQVTWEQLTNDDSNGEVKEYEIYYNIGSTIPNYCSTSTIVTGANTTVDLTGLQPATKYTVAVQAFNRQGGGPLGASKTGKTANGECTSYVCSLNDKNR